MPFINATRIQSEGQLYPLQQVNSHLCVTFCWRRHGMTEGLDGVYQIFILIGNFLPQKILFTNNFPALKAFSTPLHQYFPA